MRKEGRIQNFIIALFGITIVAMSIGFAAYSTTLTIGGGSTGNNTTVTLKKAWDVHYDTQTGATETAATADNGVVGQATATNVTFTATLNKPGDSYQFTLPVKNDGTMTAYLDSITMTPLSEAQKKYLEYKIEYDEVTANNANVTNITGKSLASNASKNMVVTVTYKTPADQADLPSGDNTTITLWAELLFEDTANS